MNDIFKIFKLDREEALAIQASANEPHSHDFEELIIGVEGEIEHFIDFQVHHYQAPFISFVTKGKVHRVLPLLKDNECFYWVLRFKSEFIPELSFNLYNYFHDRSNNKFEINRSFIRITNICEMIFDEMQQPTADLSIIRELLSSLFTMIKSEIKRLNPDQQGLLKNQNVTFKNFLSILEENFRRPEGVQYYAEKLFMSIRNLNIITQNILQKSVSEIIETRKLIEAKNLLISTDKSVSEIGYELGYTDKAYFTSVFKKKVGQTPTDFRIEMQKLIS